MTKKQKKVLKRIIISAILAVIFSLIPSKGVVRLCIFLIPYFIIGYDILKKAFYGIRSRQIFDENFLMATATIGAIILALTSNGDYLEAIAVMLFYQIGELFQSCAVGKSRKSIAQLMDIRPDYANIEENGEIVRTSPETVAPGSIIFVNPGEKIPLDGIVEGGHSAVDTSALTGESLPEDVFAGSEVLSGSINLSGVIKIKTTKNFGDSTVSKILDLVENASSLKSKSEAFISRFAKIYTPIVCFCALALIIIPPLLSFLITKNANFTTWLYRALTFLVVSCPCALVISIPLTFFASIGGMSRIGILVKGSNYIEALSKTDCAVFDKTGTLTSGTFKVRSIKSFSGTENELLHLAVCAEKASSHPIAESLKEAFGGAISKNVTDITEISGKGVEAKIDGKNVLVGNASLFKERNIKFTKNPDGATTVYVSEDGKFLGYITISDALKPTSKEAMLSLKKIGVSKTIMLTGDSVLSASAVAKELELDDFFAKLLPQDKVFTLEKLIENKKKGTSVCFVGDGINDAPVLARADVGVAMGMKGSDSAIESADVILMDDDPLKLVSAIRFSKKCLTIVRENCIFAIGIKLLCLIFTALGNANMWLAIFADVGVMVIAVLNAMRALSFNFSLKK